MTETSEERGAGPLELELAAERTRLAAVVAEWLLRRAKLCFGGVGWAIYEAESIHDYGFRVLVFQEIHRQAKG